MLFNSIEFLIFFPIVLLVYFIIPKKIKYIWLLVASYYFYMCWNAEYALLILFSTAVTYASGLLISKQNASDGDSEKIVKRKKWIVALSFIINLGILFFFKYWGFAASIVQSLFGVFGASVTIPEFDIILPVGISFYTFQALSYTMDVYRDEIKAEKNFLRYALFVSFFPQLVSGPIERSKNLLNQLSKDYTFSFERMREGVLLMLWGFFLKLVLADRIATFVDTVYEGYAENGSYGGTYLIIATLLFAIQIYCDFSGYSTIAVGAAKVIGIELTDNFNAPYLATTVAGFWRGWHISLTTWFRDYLYIPLGGNRKGKTRKFFNKMVVFLTSGLWHGASFTYVIWGGLNGLYQVIGEILMPIRNKLVKVLHLNRKSIGHKLISVITTFILVDVSWVFFRASSVKIAFSMIKSMLTTYNPWVLLDKSLYQCGLGEKEFNLMLFGILILLFADVCKHKNIKIRKVIIEQDYWVRWLVFAVSIAFILTFGVWGPMFSEQNFIYFQF